MSDEVGLSINVLRGKKGTTDRYNYKIIFTKKWFKPCVWATYYCN